MSKRQLLVILGIWVMAFLFLGFPSAWDKVFALLSGLIILVVAFKTERRQRPSSAANIPYVEHKNDIQPKQQMSDTRPITSTDTQTVS